jgi:hypothetical protein
LPTAADTQVPDAGWSAPGLRMLSEGVDVPPVLANAYERRHTMQGALHGRSDTLRARRRVNARVARAVVGRSSGSEEQADTDEERSDDEARIEDNNLAVAMRHTKSMQSAAPLDTTALVAGAATPAWLAAAAQPSKAPEPDVFQTSGASAQARARAVVRRVQNKAFSRSALPTTHVKSAAMLPLCDDSVLWAVRSAWALLLPQSLTCLSCTAVCGRLAAATAAGRSAAHGCRPRARRHAPLLSRHRHGALAHAARA